MGSIFRAAGLDEALAATTLVGGLFAAYVVGISVPGDPPNRIERGHALLFSVLYAVLPWLTIWWLHSGGEQGKFLLLAIAIAWVGDTGAYVVGKTLGRTPLAPTLSPKKTWEGAVAGVLASMIAALVLNLLVGPIFPTRTWLLASAGLAAIAGQFGDLLKSIYKRKAGVKDAGRLVPGHGGLIDRIDSLLFVAPALYLSLLLASVL